MMVQDEGETDKINRACGCVVAWELSIPGISNSKSPRFAGTSIPTSSTMDYPFQFDPTPLQTGQPPPAPNIQVEDLSLPDLMKNQHVQAMYKDWKAASNQALKSAEIQQTLWQENTRLLVENNSLKETSRQGQYVI
jgi:hypothetical protein